MTTPSASHASFVIERVFDATPAQVFAAFADPVAKARWFGAPPDQWQPTLREHDFCVGGRERLIGIWANGTVSDFDCRYFDILPGQRIVYSYAMQIDGRRISVSLSTVELSAEGRGTRMRYTEQGAYLDGYDAAGSRERGTRALFDALQASLQPTQPHR